MDSAQAARAGWLPDRGPAPRLHASWARREAAEERGTRACGLRRRLMFPLAGPNRIRWSAPSWPDGSSAASGPAASCRACRRPSASRSKPATSGSTATCSPAACASPSCSTSPTPAQAGGDRLSRRSGRGAVRHGRRLADLARAAAAAQVWAYLREHRFFGLIIPAEYGGLGFSALGQSPSSAS